MGELLDIVTPTGEYIRTADRHEVHNGAHWHEVFHCLVIRSGTPARIIMQRRHHAKAAFPGLLDLSATGHLTAGETPAEGVRELNEEMGISASAEDLVPIGVRLLVDDDGEGMNRERVNMFFMRDDRPLDAFSPEPTEVESLVEIGAGELLDAIGRYNVGDVGHRIEAVEWRPGSRPETVAIGATDLIKPVDGYWTVLLVMAERFAAGLEPLAI
jgi:isopentenyldiphosphate isomerase